MQHGTIGSANKTYLRVLKQEKINQMSMPSVLFNLLYYRSNLALLVWVFTGKQLRERFMYTLRQSLNLFQHHNWQEKRLWKRELSGIPTILALLNQKRNYWQGFLRKIFTSSCIAFPVLLYNNNWQLFELYSPWKTYPKLYIHCNVYLSRTTTKSTIQLDPLKFGWNTT